MVTAMAMDSDDDDDLTVDWGNLETITQFDSASATSNLLSSITRTTAEMHDAGRSLQSRITTKATAPVSLLVESLLQQLCTMLEPNVERSRDLYQSICERLHAVNLIDETYAMGEFEMMRSQYQKALYHLVSIARGQDLPVVLQDYWPLHQPLGLEWSRYHREFEEVSFLASGGFGKVFRARNKLDGTVYAVKKVTIRSTTIKNVLVHLAEVKTLASLNHINIVPYKAAWLEPLLSPGKSSNSTNDSSAMDDGEEEEEEEEDDDDDEQNGVASLYYSRTKLEISDSLRRPEHDSEEFVLFEGSSGGPPVSGGDENRNQVVELEDAPRGVISIEDAQPHLNLKWATLYIQMTLCHLTLREWLDERNATEDFDQFYVKFQQQRFCDEQGVSTVTRNAFCRQSSQLAGEIDPRTSDECLLADPDAASRDGSQTEGPVHHLDVVLDVFQQLLNGLNYIHSRGIVHHDIKPSNIFVSRSDHDSAITIQLGDFGLACPLQSSHAGVGFGTPLYAAPEQLEGKCDPKSDIYSLGIILLELLVPFSTDMERADMIKQVRRGQYPPDLDRDFTALLKNLLQQRPSRRPGMLDLVEAVNRIRINRDKVIAELRQSLSLRDDEIISLRTQIDEQQRVQLESDEERLVQERRTSRTLVVKEQELIYMSLKIKNKEIELRSKEMELRTKDEEICKLKEMLRTYQKKKEGQSGDANGQETNGAAR
ncbi:eukaryotic translation initiation factor 2-alpha kinase 1-like [Anopheles cruzii]|uniref:eukaryotic translation initiation factor 2-alpha kinase 1-like n=1 Tax=Anopheles cruzii TaxID=68878 RepID=UPI0022EC4E82|nr:eukaryotic translation initiation factor 2-alpha kinase 1-like [Anopheles cruzii]